MPTTFFAKRQTAELDGIVALNDLMALGLMAGFREAGLELPREMSVVGIDGHFIAALANPVLTTVQLPVQKMAEAMVERVMNPHPDSETHESQRVFAPLRLLQGGSVAPPPREPVQSKAKAKP